MAGTTTGGHDNQALANNNQAKSLGTSEIPPVTNAGTSVAMATGDTTPDSFSCAVDPGNFAEATANSLNKNQVQKFQANSVQPAMKPCKNPKSTKKPLLSENQKQSVEIELLSDMAATMSKSEKESIHKQCQDLLLKISDKEQVLSMEEIKQIVHEWKPKQEILCLYVRIARKLPANFHLDSISTLLCISKQCGYNPVNFLTKTKCLQISPSGGRYGYSFMFKTISNRSIDGNTLDRKFVGLSLTLTLLEQSVANSCGVIARDGMRSSAPRKPINKELDLGNSSTVSFKTMPSNEFHKRTSLINRLWLAINHRWMAYHLVEQLFLCQDNLCQSNAILVYSFMMHASCGKSRYQFLDPMVGICCRFKTREDIEANRTRLNNLWQNPSNFLAFGNSCLQRDTKERKKTIIVDTFAEMKRLFTRTATYGRAIENDRRWLMLRAYIFSFWLKRECNSAIRLEVESALAPVASSPNISVARKSPTTTKCILGSSKSYMPRKHNHDCPCDTTMGHAPACKRPRLDNSSMDTSLWNRLQRRSNVATPTSAQNKQATTEDKSSTNFCPFATRDSLINKDWSSIKLLTQAELDKVTASYLLVHTDGGLDISSKLSPLEVYSADKLKDFRHARVCGPPGYQPSQQLGEVVLQIGSGCDEYLDRYSKLYHIARQGSVYFKEYKSILPADCIFANLCKSILKHGKIDHARSKCQYRINIGCGGQHFPDGVPATIIGKGFADKLEADNDFDRVEILSGIGSLVEFLWRVSQDMQSDVCDAPLAPDSLRFNAYAKHLCRYLFIDEDVGFEDITLVISPLTGEEHDVVSEHTDVMNDNLGGYSRTCVFNACFSLDHDAFLHMQVIGNFRRTVRQYMVPFERSLQSTIANGRRYVASWQADMQVTFAGISSNRIWNPFDRSQFFLDDGLPFTRLQIFDGTSNKNKPEQPSVYGDYLLTEIGLSRVTSLSMFIDPISKLKDTLSTDQRIELAFFASLLSNPFWFHYAFNKLTSRCNEGNHASTFGIHPMYDVVRELYSIFGTWQGGPHNRWSPCGGAVPVVELFGAHPSATNQEKELGMKHLEAVLEVLFCHLEWVNSLKGKGLSPLNDLPLSTIQTQWESIRRQIHDIIPCQFSLFRLSVFTTIVIGCNELSPGPHLKQITIPLPGTSSFKHLLAPSKGQISKQSAKDLATNTKEVIVQPNEDDRVTNDDHDRLMLYLSNAFGRKQYVRDEMECLLCESHPGRSLDCRDWFCKGQNIFDCSDDGIILMRPYGKECGWREIGSPKIWTFRFLKRRSEVEKSKAHGIHYKVDQSIARYAHSFGNELRQFQERITFNGRSSIKSKCQSEYYDNPFLHHSTRWNQHLTLHHYRSANMFSRQYCKETSKSKMVVLGNGEKPKKLLHESNEFESFANGNTLLEKVRETLNVSYGGDDQEEEEEEKYQSMMAGCYHQEVDNASNRITYFPGHLDKCYIHNVWFVPLSCKQFFTFIAVPSSWKIAQDLDSHNDYQSWLSVISQEEKNSVLEFHDLFQRDARKFMKLESLTPLVFSNKLGSVLQFPPNRCFHATIIPAERQERTTKTYRDLLIVHPLVTM